MDHTIRIRAAARAEMASHCASSPWAEVCGLLAGRESVITAIYPAKNVAANAAISYEIAPEELFVLMRAMRADRLELLGIYHSHPRTANEPSERDIERAYYPDVAYLILSPNPGALQSLRAFSIRDGRVEELQIEIVD